MTIKKISFKIACILAAALVLFCACGKRVTAYFYSTDGETVTETEATLSGITFNNLTEQLVKMSVLPENTSVESFQNISQGDAKTVKLDYSAELSEYISACDSVKAQLTLQCIANTYIKNYDADSVQITCLGEAIKTDECDFSKPFTFVSPHAVATLAVPVTEKATEEAATALATATAATVITPSPTATSAPTQQATSKPTATPKPKDGTKKYVALSFDDGPHTKYTRLIVDELKKYNAGATFFVVGNRIDEVCGAAIKYASENGCEIQIHGYTHEVYYNKCSEERYQEELSKTAAVIEKYTGITPTLMRPIGGAISAERVASSKYPVIIWSVDSEDWKHKSTSNASAEVNTIVENITKDVKDGSIILMHEIYQNSYDAFCIVMERLTSEGYEVVTVSDLLAGELSPGKKYYNR